MNNHESLVERQRDCLVNCVKARDAAGVTLGWAAQTPLRVGGLLPVRIGSGGKRGEFGRGGSCGDTALRCQVLSGEPTGSVLP